MTLKWLRLCALVLVSSGLFLAGVGCGQCPLSEFDTNGDGTVSPEEFQAADPASLEALQTQFLTDPFSLLACGDFLNQALAAADSSTAP